MSSLQDILPLLRKPKILPGALPLIHVSKSGRPGFEQIIDDLSLSPPQNPCEVFKQHLLYFSYGNVFYDTGDKATRDLTKLPICFLFNPSALSEINYYFPYDTGAAYRNKYGKHSEHLSSNFDKYKVVGNSNNIYPPIQLTYYIYKNNENYRNGQIETKHEPKLCQSLPELFNFLEDQNIEGCDERQYTIECQAAQKINLNNYLEWIAFPETYSDLFSKLFKLMQPSPPYRYSYHPGTIYHPQRIIGEIKLKAKEYIENRYL